LLIIWPRYVHFLYFELFQKSLGGGVKCLYVPGTAVYCVAGNQAYPGRLRAVYTLHCTHSPYTILVSRIQFALCRKSIFILSLGGIEHRSVDTSRPAAATAAAAAATATAAAD
jgi:hypothetical protein